MGKPRASSFKELRVLQKLEMKNNFSNEGTLENGNVYHCSLLFKRENALYWDF